MDDEDDETEYEATSFVMRVNRRYASSRLSRSRLSGAEHAIHGQHAIATIEDEPKPHTICITTDRGRHDYQLPAEPHDIGFQRCGAHDVIMLRCDAATLALMTPGSRFRVHLEWRAGADDFDILTDISLEQIAG